MSGHFERVVAFIRSIGIGVREAPTQRKTLVPGIDIVLGTLVVDRGALSMRLQKPLRRPRGLTIEKRSPQHDDAVVYPGMIAWVRS
jgi:hypothetical protein